MQGPNDERGYDTQIEEETWPGWRGEGSRPARMMAGRLRVVEGSCPSIVRQQASDLGWEIEHVEKYGQVYREQRNSDKVGKRSFSSQAKANDCDVEDRPVVISWKTSRFLKSDYAKCQGPGYRLNHIPHSYKITKKDLLLRQLRQLQAAHGSVYRCFMPQAFLLPSEYTKFVRQYAEDEEEEKTSVWICKPTDLSRGRKIFLIRTLSELRYDQQCVLQRYVPNPLTIGGYKVDLRIYVLVTSIQPLRIYVYQDGLARFGTEKYDSSNLNNLFAHLTNTSINKFSGTYDDDKDVIGSGAKWDLNELRSWFDTSFDGGREKYDNLWRRICNIVALTILSIVPDKNTDLDSSFFELFGFDIITDENFVPYLLEVNCAPSLSVDCEQDARVKGPLIRDVLQLVQAETKRNQRRNHLPLRHRRSKSVYKKVSSASSLKPNPGASESKRYVQRRKPPLVSRHIATKSKSKDKEEMSQAFDEEIKREQGLDIVDVQAVAAPPKNNHAAEDLLHGPGENEKDGEEWEGSQGNFQLIFPFDDVTRTAAEDLYFESLKAEPSTQALTRDIRTIVARIKKRL